MAKEHAVRAAQHDLPSMGVCGEVVDVELLPVARAMSDAYWQPTGYRVLESEMPNAPRPCPYTAASEQKP